MFGLFRLYLALAVVAHHLLRVPTVGNAAVFAFFTLSGFLMTHVLAKTYGYGPKGFAAYLFNRALRLLPAYWVAIGLSLLFILIVGEPFADKFNDAFGIPPDLASWGMNVTMIFPSLHPSEIEPRLLPIVWTLTVEIFYYVLMGLGATRTPLSSMLMFACGVAYHLYGITTGQDFGFHYHSIFAGAMPFAAGALAFHYRDALSKILSDRAVMLLCLHMAVLAGGAAAYAIDVKLFHHGIEGRASLMIDLANLFAAVAISVLTIGAVYRPASYVIGKALDDALGKYSYPFYLLHVQTSMLISYLVFGHRVSGMTPSGLIGFALTMIFITLVGWAVIRFVEPGVDRLRDRVKKDQGSRSPGQPAQSRRE